MVWLAITSAAVIALILWVNRLLPRASKPPAEAELAMEPKPSPARPPLSATPSVVAHAPPASEPAARLVPLMDRPATLPDRENPISRPIAGVRWIPFGEDVQLRNSTIRGGGFYLGQSRDFEQPVAGCVDPSLPVDISAPDWLAEDMHYWPRYATISARQRGAYLAWLHSKRDYAQLGIGIVFLYFFNLERRILVDARRDSVARAEVPTLLAEIQRLLTIYGQNASFRSYAHELLSLASAVHQVGEIAIDETVESWTTALRMRIGRRMQAGEPISALEGFAIARAVSPEAQRNKWDVVLPELRALFEQRFARTFAQGLKLPVPKGRIAVDYKWASPEGQMPRFTFDVPDPATLTAPYRPLSTLLDAVLLDVEPLRKVRRSKNRTPAAELAATPAELLRTKVPAEFARLRDSIDAVLNAQPNAPIALAALISAMKWPPDALTKRSATQLVQTIESLGFGIEPDPRFHGQLPAPESTVQVFRVTSDSPRTPTPAYSAAQLLAQAAIAISDSGNGIQTSEVDALIAGVERQFALTSAEHVRLQAHVQFLHRELPQISRIEARARLLPERDRIAFGQVLIDIAAADGHISSAETKLLERLYKALGLDIGKVHADLHHATVKAQREPVAGHALSADAIAQRMAETQRVQAVLTAIFDNESAASPQPAPSQSSSASTDLPAATSSPPPACAPARTGRDSAHDKVLRALLAHPVDTIPRETLEVWCNAQGLLTEGAIENLNNASFNVCGEALLEGEDPLEINSYAADQLRANL